MSAQNRIKDLPFGLQFPSSIDAKLDLDILQESKLTKEMLDLSLKY